MKHTLTILLTFIFIGINAQIGNSNKGISTTIGNGRVGFETVSGYAIPVPLTYLDFYWDGGISSTDSTLLNRKTGTYDSNWKLLSFDGSLDSNYLSTKSTTLLKVYGDTIPVVCLFHNYNYADTLFFKINSQTINADSTENYPRRCTEIAFYGTEVNSTDSSTLWTYFSVPALAINGYCFVGTNVGDSSTIVNAIAGASANDTIYVRSGIYRPATTMAINKTVTLIGIGRADIRTASGTYAVQFSSNGIRFENFKLTGGTVSGIYCLTNSGHTIKNIHLSGFTSYCIFDRTTNTWDNIYMNAQGTTNAINSQSVSSVYTNFRVSGTGTQPPIYVFAASGTPNIKYYWFKVNALGTGAYDEIFWFRYAGNYYIRYSELYGITGNMFYESSNIENKIYLDYNTINFTPASSMINFTTTNNAGWLYVRNNTITNPTANNTIYATAFSKVRIENNVINNTGNGRGMYIANGIDSVIILGNVINQYGQSASFIRTGDATGVETYYCLVEKNILHGSEYFNPLLTSTSHGIFNYAVRNQITRYNYMDGLDLGIVYKGDSLNNTSALIFANILDDCKALSKGQRNVKFYNNTIYDHTYSIHIMNNNDVHPTDFDASGCDIQNNILTSDDGNPAIYIEQSESESGLNCDYNVLFNNDVDSIVLKQSTYMDFATWQGEGYDLNSYNSDPNFNSSVNLWPVAPSDAIENGTDLGATYDDGLDITTDWTTTPPTIITRQQGANWTIGAYVIE